ncbi:MAG: hypothetical protein U1F36_09430 [Planctomycetota bacterium]
MVGILPRLLLGAAIATAAVLAVDQALREETAGEVLAASLSCASEPAALGIAADLPTGTAWLIYLLQEGAEVPPLVAPLVSIEDGGGVRVLRAAPPPTGPRDDPWLAAGILFPGRALADLGARERAALLESMRRWRGGLQVAPRARIVTSAADATALVVLLRFLR